MFERFLSTISRYVPVDPLAGGRGDELARLNPDKIYVENVRTVLGVSHSAAVRICEVAVRQGLFSRRVEVLCPDNVVAASAEREDELPDVVRCWYEEDGQLNERVYPTRELPKATFYRLNGERSVAETA